MDFLYFPEDKSEYIPGIISVVIIFILSILIVRLLTKASRKQVKKLEEQGYPVVYKDGLDVKNVDDNSSELKKTQANADEQKRMHDNKET
ncbi:hypothetical protein [Planococcus versutus]|uniref:Uncharacterized protein n=1 Tax=Planococcus versutus TaxID=1302659 RepID=A0A1B1S042_9BACL|nr:hypothetical protein [Planococcus versutus]ANU26588.1 hypothetical protein I858_006065 [Planococcus versutus]